MKKKILVSALITMTIVFFAFTVCVKAQSAPSKSSTVVAKDKSVTPKACCKTGATITCDKSKCDKSKCDMSKCDMSKCDMSKCDKSKCGNSGAGCSNHSGCMETSGTTKKSSCCDATKNKTKTTDTK